jgi:hypothetical protein
MRRWLLLLPWVVLHASCGESPLVADPPPAPAATRDGRWIQDVDYLVGQLSRLHLNLFFRTPRTEIEAAAADLKRSLPALTDHEVIVGLMRITALPGDAHTGVRPWSRFRRLPLGFTRLSSGLFVTAAEASLASGLGARVVAIGDRPVEELEAAAAAIVSHENEAWLRVQVPAFLAVPEVLHALGAAPDASGARVWLEDAQGARFSLNAPAVASMPALLDLTAAAGRPLPLHRQRTAENYWSTLLEDSRTLYVQYNRCQQGSEPFAAFAERMLRQLDEGRADRLVVDVRHNVGGNSEVDDPLIEGLRRRAAARQRGRLFGLIAEETFSSGMWTAVDLRNLGAVMVGGPTGGKPNSYGDVGTFVLPNSRIEVGYSTKIFRLVEGSDPASVMPDLLVEPSIDDLREGRDPLLEAALRFPR